jgi:hypothetical protein
MKLIWISIRKCEWRLNAPGSQCSDLTPIFIGLHRNAPLSPMKEGARVHHSYGSYAPSTYGSYEARRANPSTVWKGKREWRLTAPGWPGQLNPSNMLLISNPYPPTVFRYETVRVMTLNAPGGPGPRTRIVDDRLRAWEKQALSARGVKRVERHSEHAIQTLWGGA